MIVKVPSSLLWWYLLWHQHFGCHRLSSEWNLQLQHYFHGENMICFTMSHFLLSYQGWKVEKAIDSPWKLNSTLLLSHLPTLQSCLGLPLITWTRTCLNPFSAGTLCRQVSSFLLYSSWARFLTQHVHIGGVFNVGTVIDDLLYYCMCPEMAIHKMHI